MGCAVPAHVIKLLCISGVQIMMKSNMDYIQARDLLLSLTAAGIATEYVSLEESVGRVLAFALHARENVPAFDRSPYDGYAFRAADTKDAGRDNPAELRIIEEIPAGSVPTKTITQGTAAKILTGAPIPEGADAVVMFEKTEFTTDSVKIFECAEPGDNIVRIGEDVKKGQLLADAGTVIDAGLAGTLAAQGISRPMVFKRPVVGIISTGSELVEFDGTNQREETDDANKSEKSVCCGESTKSTDENKPEVCNTADENRLNESGRNEPGQIVPGKIRNTNRYTFAAALQKDGCETVYLGTARDDVDEIRSLIDKGLRDCDMIILTGGVSVGDYDLTPEAMQGAGCEILAKGVNLKPGMACCYGVYEMTRDAEKAEINCVNGSEYDSVRSDQNDGLTAAGGKLVCALSGNPSSSLINYYAVVRPAVRKLAGLKKYLPEQISVTLAENFGKKSKATRILKGHLDISNGQVMMHIPKGQGNVMIGSSIGCDVMAIVPAGSGALEAGTRLEGFLV